MKKHQLVTNTTGLARLGKFADKLIGKLVEAGNSDSRDWDKIRGWGKQSDRKSGLAE